MADWLATVPDTNPYRVQQRVPDKQTATKGTHACLSTFGFHVKVSPLSGLLQFVAVWRRKWEVQCKMPVWGRGDDPRKQPVLKNMERPGNAAWP
ncbi:hypothetical protein PoB_003367800 [Plakobranchus ocellatus]|uniref:Uncharacterized protein n=1 Tax=Plakobranchus ocellatus TaxID=259542 RepID=A0AAV4AK72_9GAST|nr:hypothetical protein PoB_003367800 [Plakobranchus ocellatus]